MSRRAAPSHYKLILCLGCSQEFRQVRERLAQGRGHLCRNCLDKGFYERWENSLQESVVCHSLNVAADNILREDGFYKADTSDIEPGFRRHFYQPAETPIRVATKQSQNVCSSCGGLRAAGSASLCGKCYREKAKAKNKTQRSINMEVARRRDYFLRAAGERAWIGWQMAGAAVYPTTPWADHYAHILRARRKVHLINLLHEADNPPSSVRVVQP